MKTGRLYHNRLKKTIETCYHEKEMSGPIRLRILNKFVQSPEWCCVRDLVTYNHQVDS